MIGDFIYLKNSWEEIKQKYQNGLNIYYEELPGNNYKIYVIDKSIIYFCILYSPNTNLTIIGKSPTNDLDYDDFITNYKTSIDQNIKPFSFPISIVDNLKVGNKLKVASSPKPESETKSYFSCWSNSGDDVINHIIWGGDKLSFSFSPGINKIEKRLYFDPVFGDVFIYSGCCMWKNGNEGDSMYAGLWGPATLLQTHVNLNLVLEGTRVKYSEDGPGTGTHGFASNPILIPNKTRSGYWNYSPVTGLVPDLTGNGKYDIFTEEKEVFRMINGLEFFGNSNGYIDIKGLDSVQILYPYFIKVVFETNGNSNLYASCYLCLYRENS